MSEVEHSTSPEKRILRLGIICNGYSLEQWQADCVQRLLDSGLSRLVLLVVDDGSCKPSSSLRAQPFKRWLYTLYRRTWFSKAPRKSVDMNTVFSHVSTVRPRITLKGKFSQYFDNESLDAIREHDLDFILRFGLNIIRGSILEVPRYGVWSFHHDDEMKYRGSPAGFWEIYLGDPVTGAMLQRLTDRLDGGIVLKRGYLSTINHSYLANLESIYCESATWPVQVCRDILNGNAEYFQVKPSLPTAPIYYPPGNTQMLRFLAILAWNKLCHGFRKRFMEYQWNIGLVRDSIERFIDPAYKPDIEWLPDLPRGKFYADPFPLFGQHKDKVMFESFDYGKGKAEIACGTCRNSSDKFRIHSVQNAMAVQTHLSYPHTFEYEGVVYCIPETYQTNRVVLYRAVELPYHWEEEAVLIQDMAAVDATVFRHEGTWWMFCTDRNWGSKHNLFIFHSEKLTGPWKAHDGNPVKTDVRSSRPAGTPFVHEGSLYRPAQDCSWTYGGRIAINRVTLLSEREFVEEAVAQVQPVSPYGEGLHTLTEWEDCTLVDGKRSRLRWMV